MTELITGYERKNNINKEKNQVGNSFDELLSLKKLLILFKLIKCVFNLVVNSYDRLRILYVFFKWEKFNNIDASRIFISD
jgi:hypothetical protein